MNSSMSDLLGIIDSSDQGQGILGICDGISSKKLDKNPYSKARTLMTTWKTFKT